MSAPWRVNDGNFSVPLIVKDGYRFPFSERGDGKSFEYVMRQRFDKSNVLQNVSMTPRATGLGVAYLVGIGDLEDTGDGIFEQELVYASVPQSRTESEGIVYGQQIRTSASAAAFYYETTAEVQYDYGIGPLQKFPAPRFFMNGATLLYRGKTPPPQTGKVIAKDPEVTLYKGNIYQRKTMYVTFEPFKAVGPINA